MRKHVYVGLRGNMACMLESIADFDYLESHSAELEESDFVHSSTNWHGCDTLERLLSLNNLHVTGRALMPGRPLVFCGVDYDHGHEDGWSFRVNMIHEAYRDGEDP